MFDLPRQIVARLAMAVAVLIPLMFAAGCSGPPVAPESKELAFPGPPDDPKFYFERTIFSSADVVPASEQDMLANLLTGQSAGAEGLAKPYAIAVHQGRLFVSDSVERKVKVFDIPGGKVSSYGDPDELPLIKPMGLDVDRAGNLYVADITERTVFVISPQGKLLRRIGSKADFDRPTSVTVDPEGIRVFVVDIGGVQSEHHRVRVFDALSGAFLFDIGTRGSTDGKFNLPRDVAIGKDRRLYVTDGGNFRVQVFDWDGKFIKAWGKVGKQPGDFARPKEIATDNDGNVYIADAAFGNVQIFDPEGLLLMFIGTRSEQNRPAGYMLPSGVFVDEDGRIYLVDQWFRKIDIYRPARLAKETGYLTRRAVTADKTSAPATEKEGQKAGTEVAR